MVVETEAPINPPLSIRLPKCCHWNQPPMIPLLRPFPTDNLHHRLPHQVSPIITITTIPPPPQYHHHVSS
jgi:hypothetical protein